MTELDAIRSKLSGLHFAQDAMRPHERETLHLAEELLRRIDDAAKRLYDDSWIEGKTSVIAVTDIYEALGLDLPLYLRQP